MRQIAVLLLVALAGCLDRTETITVHEDGGLAIEHRIKGDGSDLDGGEARYPGAEAWRVERTVRDKDDGSKEHILTATARFAAAADVPTRFGAADAEHALTMSTNVTIRREDGRTHYRFVRTYEPRDWAHYRFYYRRTFTEDVEKLLDTENLGELPATDRRRLLEAAVAYESMKWQRWAELATEKVAPRHPRLLETQLATRRAIAGYTRQNLAFEKLDGILAKSSEEVDALALKVDDDVRGLTLDTAAQELGLGVEDVARLSRALVAARRDFDVSKDLEDESFRVRLELPGRLTGDNGDEHEKGYVVWHFDGKALRDRRHVLVATSVVEEDK